MYMYLAALYVLGPVACATRPITTWTIPASNHNSRAESHSKVHITL